MYIYVYHIYIYMQRCIYIYMHVYIHICILYVDIYRHIYMAANQKYWVAAGLGGHFAT